MASGKYDRSARRGPHLVYDLRGSFFEVGLQHGRLLKSEIVEEAGPALKVFSENLGKSEGKALDWIVSRYEPVFMDLVPSAIEEIRGMAEGSGLGYPYAFFAATRDGMKIPGRGKPIDKESPDPSCTAFVCGKEATRDGKVLVGQTKDTAAPLSRYRIMRVVLASGERRVLLNYPGWMANICVTSRGMAFTGNSLYAREPDGETVPFSLLKRLVLESRSVSEVLKKIEGLSFENLCTMMGDAGGHLVCLETAAGRRWIKDVSGQAFGHANSVLSPELKSYDSVPPVLASSPVRQRNIQRLLDEKRGDITVQDLKVMLADHTDFPRSICRHPSEEEDLVTTAAYICDLTEKQIHIVVGNPCLADFKTYDLRF